MNEQGYSIVVLTLGVGCYYYICSLGFLRTFIRDVANTVPRFFVLLMLLWNWRAYGKHMKKLLFIVVLLLTSMSIYAQDDVTKFMGIPVDGSKSDMIKKLKSKGFISSELDKEILKGEFNGRDVYVVIATNNNKVFRIVLRDKIFVDETSIKIRFNTLCLQFENNSKYITTKEYSIPDHEDISYEMSVNKKRYEASFYQRAEESGSSIMKSVWFRIDEYAGEYGILMYYDNEYNRANGEDL